MDLMERQQVLDYGYVDLVEFWGSDERIIESARMSTNKGFNGWEKDEKLLSFLYNNKHMTPFEMCGMTIEVKAPIFVFREWHRHRTQSYNEMSARYIPLPDENYMPSRENIQERISSHTSNKQAQGNGNTPTRQDLVDWLELLEDAYYISRLAYEHAIKIGVSKELARLSVPVARYSRMRASANLRNWLAFLTLRMDEAAQFEIRQYANAVGVLVAENFPRTWDLFIQNMG
jgi:thymidylate synthase (FAD)